MRSFHNSSFDPQTLLLLETAFDETVVRLHNGDAMGRAITTQMSSDPIVSIFFGGELSKSGARTIRPYYLHAPNVAFVHSQ
jgi:hypothetical protein